MLFGCELLTAPLVTGESTSRNRAGRSNLPSNRSMTYSTPRSGRSMRSAPPSESPPPAAGDGPVRSGLKSNTSFSKVALSSHRRRMGSVLVRRRTQPSLPSLSRVHRYPLGGGLCCLCSSCERIQSILVSCSVLPPISACQCTMDSADSCPIPHIPPVHPNQSNNPVRTAAIPPAHQKRERLAPAARRGLFPRP